MFIYALQSGKRGPSQSIFGQSWQVSRDQLAITSPNVGIGS
jgi:hypothetical protein